MATTSTAASILGPIGASLLGALAQSLIKVDPISATVAYDPDAYSTIINTLLNAKTGSVTFWFPSGDSVDVYGYLQKFEPQELKIGEYPMAQITIEITNYDSANFLEVGPVYTAAAGT